MTILKPALIFISAYTVLTLLGIVVNDLLKLHPQVSLNIVSMVLAALSIKKVINVKSKHSFDLLFISMLGGGLAVASLVLFSVYYESFVTPSVVEALLSFVFNAGVVYFTIYLASLKKK